MGKISKFVMLLVLRGYKWAISPMSLPACRYVPSCSDYAMEAVERYGAVRGGLMGLWRLLRCHPFARGGYDPVVQGVGLKSSQVSQSLAKSGRAGTSTFAPALVLIGIRKKL
jgi:hypothetical protein